jgi:hypothetical protein
MVDFVSQPKLAPLSADSASSSANFSSYQMTIAHFLAYFICFIYLPCAASYGRSEAAFGIM